MCNCPEAGEKLQSCDPVAHLNCKVCGMLLIQMSEIPSIPIFVLCKATLSPTIPNLWRKIVFGTWPNIGGNGWKYKLVESHVAPPRLLALVEAPERTA